MCMCVTFGSHPDGRAHGCVSKFFIGLGDLFYTRETKIANFYIKISVYLRVEETKNGAGNGLIREQQQKRGKKEKEKKRNSTLTRILGGLMSL